MRPGKELGLGCERAGPELGQAGIPELFRRVTAQEQVSAAARTAGLSTGRRRQIHHLLGLFLRGRTGTSARSRSQRFDFPPAMGRWLDEGRLGRAAPCLPWQAWRGAEVRPPPKLCLDVTRPEPSGSLVVNPVVPRRRPRRAASCRWRSSGAKGHGLGLSRSGRCGGGAVILPAWRFPAGRGLASCGFSPAVAENDAERAATGSSRRRRAPAFLDQLLPPRLPGGAAGGDILGRGPSAPPVIEGS